MGNFTGEADFITPRECLAGNPRVYAQLVNVLRPYSRAQPPAPTRKRPRAKPQDAVSVSSAVSAITPETALAHALGGTPPASGAAAPTEHDTP